MSTEEIIYDQDVSSPLPVLLIYLIGVVIITMAVGLIPLINNIKRLSPQLIKHNLKDSLNSIFFSMGSGMLVASCTQILLPEIFFSLYESQIKLDSNSIEHWKYGALLTIGFLSMLFIEWSFDLKFIRSLAGNSAWLTTACLCIHGFADGLMVGTAALSKNESFRLSVFFAMAAHRAPTAFGMVTRLLQDNVDKRAIKYHLIMFSMTTPIAAILMYLCQPNIKDDIVQLTNKGVSLQLASTGSFLYIATSHLKDSCHQEKNSFEHDKSIIMKMGCFFIGCAIVSVLSALFENHH